MNRRRLPVHWTPSATEDLRAAYDYWAREKSEEAADLMLDRIFTTVELLETNPEIGRRGRVAETRELMLNRLPFLIVYYLNPTEIEIVALFHGARKWPGQF